MPPAAFAVSPTIAFSRNIQTKPFVGTSVSIRDNEGLSYVPANNQLWLVDDSTDKLYAFDKDTGVLGQTFSKSQFAAATKLGGTELAGSSRFEDGEAVAYDDANDTLYVFSGTCCTSSVKPTVFRLQRTSRTGAFSIDSWQPLLAPYNDLSGVGARGSEIWVGAGKTLAMFDYVTNTTTSPRTFLGISGYLGIDFDSTGTEMWVADKGNHVKKYDFASGTQVAGFDWAMSSYNCRDARAIELVGNQIFVSDGYDYYGSVSTAWGVRVYDLGGGAIPAPVASFTATPTTGTVPLTVSFTDTSSHTPTTWSWNFGDGTSSTLQHPTHIYATPGNYDVRLTATNAAGSNVSPLTTISVTNAAPVASFTKTGSSGTAPLSVGFTDTSTNAPTSWSWNFGDGSPVSTARNPTHIFTATGTFNVTHTATNAAGTGTSAAQPVVVSAAVLAPVASFTKTVSSGTTPLSVGFTDTSTNVPTSWSWNFGDGSPATTTQNPTHVFSGVGTYNVTLTATNAGGSNTSPAATISVTAVVVAPVAAFTMSPSSPPAALPVHFTDTSTNAPTSWSWDFGDGGSSVQASPSHTFVAEGSYDVTLTVTNSAGSDSVIRTLVVSAPVPVPVASFTASADSGVAPLLVDFTDTSTNAPTSWSWNFGDGTALVTTQNPSHTFNAGGVFSVRLTATNAGGSDTSAVFTVTVTTPVVAPVASFTRSPGSGLAPLSVAFTDGSTNGPTSWSWDFGDGAAVSTAQNPSHVFSTVGTFTVMLTATNSAGSSSSTQTVTVNATSTTTTVIASEDAYVTQASPTTTHPTGSQIYNLASPTAATRGYVKFSVTGVTGTVTSAKLRLWVTDGTDNGGAWWLVSNAWTEAAVTWANGPAPTSGVLVGDPAATVAGGWLEIDVTARVGGNGTYSFASLPTSTNGEKFSTREGVNPAQLVIVTG